MNLSPVETDRKQGTCLEVMVYGNPVLRGRSQPVGEITPEIRQLAEDMIVTMFEHDTRGVGLAAPQIGVSIRLITLATSIAGEDLPPDASPGERVLAPRMPIALVNPEIVSASARTACRVEGCLSVPGVEGEVGRPASIVLKAQTLDGQSFQVDCGGLLARCLQHETDHLDGVLFVDRLDETVAAELAGRLRALGKRETGRLKKPGECS